MTDNFDIPEDLRGSYKRVIYRAPEKLRTDDNFQQLTLLHLKVGGERLARQNTELFKLVLEEQKIFNRGLQNEEARLEQDPPENETEDKEDVATSEEEDDGDEDEETHPENDSPQSDSHGTSELQAGPDRDHILLTMECWGDGEIL